MVNPFEKRASEYLRDDEAFLSVVSPEPLTTYFGGHARNGTLLDRLVVIYGTPGSGKTTLSRLFQFSAITALRRSPSSDGYRAILDALRQCGAVRAGEPAVLGYRIPLESEYREFWQLPYDDDLKFGLMTALVQARAVLGWMRSLQAAGADLEDVKVVAREGVFAGAEAIGGPETDGIATRARELERALYSVSAALVPPSVRDLPEAAVSAYQPFDVIERIDVRLDGAYLQLRPLIILDDAHTLHRDQFARLRQWLGRREPKIGRWVITRLDALTPDQVLQETGPTVGRDITEIPMQSASDRGAERKAFRELAMNMSQRYLRRWDTFANRGAHDLSAMLQTREVSLPAAQLTELRGRVDALQDRIGLVDRRRRELEKLVNDQVIEPDLRLAALAITMERYRLRTKAQVPELDLFDTHPLELDLTPSVPLSVNAEVIDGARIHLMHQFNRPYYFGMTKVCDAAGQNAEQFLHLAAALLSQIETKMIRGHAPSLTAREQDRILHARATQTIDEWDFPHAGAVRRLTEQIGALCVERSLEPNAPLGGGAIAFGVPQHQYDGLIHRDRLLAEVIQFAIAYNAITVQQHHKTKNREWCLLELGGNALLKSRLTFRRGGSVEGTVADLLTMVER
ncbi:hypothetical protein [Cellulomonas sp. URHB0016]